MTIVMLYTVRKKSRITVKAYLTELPRQDWVVIAVEDQGIGIESKNLERLFE